ncbi:MAG: hypothetical protein GF308_03250 [Candidatus Heimdallarchaeota archaeon]|nr:hypothetical protein [Candidatus Heimdallarchaeota archaeon]
MSSKKSIGILIERELLSKHLEYTLQTIFADFLGLTYEILLPSEWKEENFELSLFYGDKIEKMENCQIIIHPSDFWSNFLQKDSMPQLPLNHYTGTELKKVIKRKTLPILFVSEKRAHSDRDFLIANKQVIMNIDIFASIFFMLSRYEEMIIEEEDEHGRFPASKSFSLQAEILTRPIVNEYLEFLWYWMKKIKPELTRKEKQFQLYLSHDIDELKLWTLRKRIAFFIKTIIRDKSLIKLLNFCWRNFLWLFMFPKNPFKFINQQSNKFYVKSHFFFLLDGTSKYDNRINYQSKKFQRILQYLEKNGHEIGLHSSYSSHLHLEQLKKEKKLLQRYTKTPITSVRGHYLRFKVPTSYSLIDECSFKIDSTLGYSSSFGYRAGVCYPFRPYNIRTQEIASFYEYPLIAMDVTLISKKRAGLKPKETQNLLESLMDEIAFYQGTFVLLIHNHSLENLEYPWRRIYKNVLKHYSTIIDNE